MAQRYTIVQKLLHLLRFQRSELASVYLYAAISGLVQLSLPLGIQSVISFVQGAEMSTSLVFLIAFVIGGVALAGLLQVSVMRVIERVQQELFVRYSLSFAEGIPHVSQAVAADGKLQKATLYFFDVVVLQKGIAKLLIDVPAAIIQILFGLILLSFYHVSFLVFALLLVFLLTLLFRYTGAAGLASAIEESNYKYKVGSYLQSLAATQAAGQSQAAAATTSLEKTDGLTVSYLGARTEHFRILKTQYWIIIAFKVLITASMLILGVALMVKQQLSIGQFIAIEIVIILVMASVEKLIVRLDAVYDVLTAVEKLSKISSLPREPQSPASA